MSIHSQRHIKSHQFATILEANAQGRPYEICYVKETGSWYEFVSSYPQTIDNKKRLATGQGGFSRWVARGGQYVERFPGVVSSSTQESIAMAVALGF